MKKALYISFGMALLSFGLLVADVKTDYSHSTDFRAYRTYSWLKVEAANSLWEDRIRQAVDSQLSAKGLSPQPNGGDLAVAAFGRMSEQKTYNTFYDGLGGGWFWRGFGDGLATTTVESTPVGTLSVDMFDGKTKKLVWRGISTKTLSGDAEKNSKKLQDSVADMFKKFPPKGES